MQRAISSQKWLLLLIPSHRPTRLSQGIVLQGVEYQGSTVADKHVHLILLILQILKPKIISITESKLNFSQRISEIWEQEFGKGRI